MTQPRGQHHAMKNLQLELTIDETNLILEALGALPFARVYTLIGRIQESARKQIHDPPVDHGASGADREHAR
ncbi:MAG TPA: hypothetical protein VF516_45835 [Kofleriaceae bacterium]